MATTYPQYRTMIRTVSGVDALAGVWLLIAPFVVGYSAIQTALWNDLLAGIAVVILASSRAIGEGYKYIWPSWLTILIGIWLLFAPSVLGYSHIRGAFWNDILLGIIVVGFALWGAFAKPKEEA